MRRIPAMGLVVGIVAALAVVVPTPPAGACSCAGPPLERADEATTIFTGTPTGPGDDVEVPGAGVPDSLRTARQIVLDVDQVWRGEVYEQQAIVVWPAGCELAVDGPGALVVVSVAGDEADVELPEEVVLANLCTTAPLTGLDAAALERLGPAVVEPRPGASPTVEAEGSARSRTILLAAGIAAVALIGVGATIAVRRRRTS